MNGVGTFWEWGPLAVALVIAAKGAQEWRGDATLPPQRRADGPWVSRPGRAMVVVGVILALVNVVFLAR